ncbi:MAG: hypothetical protein COX57_02840 [Alphaproteobacteria bacterium CG_4_10_14_0_2_um_filter_63_37]|nr:MAG: hypothetical protein AUJ55_03310 [Proteobacteria bacterium CG1_02_64_396]PJA25481.1 MAG: hypothetical protein COX57_02840 [Alphaproteobacteria bacterium CG_4_10_14_0_2_um_filter_63_37]
MTTPWDIAPSDAVQWSEGMLLGPQHLQQSDLYWQRQQLHLSARNHPYFWGVLRLGIDTGVLDKGQVRVDLLHAVMPDGLAVRFPAADERQTLVCDLKDHPWDEQPTARIYLAVPQPGEGREAGRYIPVGTQARDENTGQSTIALSRLRPVLALFDGKPSAKYVSIPLVEVRRNEKKQLELTPFHPPMLRADACPFLGEEGLPSRLQTMTVALRDKLKELAGGDGGGAQGGRTLLTPLAAALPPLEVWVETPAAHPFDLYLALAQAAGHLAALDTRPIPPKPLPYDHNHCIPGFSALIAHVGSILERQKTTFEIFPFERIEGGTFQRKLPEGMGGDLVIELRPQKGQSQEEIARWASQTRIGDKILLPELRRRRLRGALLDKPDPAKVGEIALQASGLLLAITDRTVTLEEGGKEKLVRMFTDGSTLTIEGPGVGSPAAILLYRTQNEAPRG